MNNTNGETLELSNSGHPLFASLSPDSENIRQTIEQTVLSRCGVNTPQQLEYFYDSVDQATARWACITSKSQRESKISDKWRFDVFENVTMARPVFENMESKLPPSREGKVIHEFSQRSRSRMQQKFRKMKKDDLELPYFVTLTYQENTTDFERAKRHLNAFFQRFRRLDRTPYYVENPEYEPGTRKKPYHKKYKSDKNFHYAWKMEPQERGAIHFHLMFFPFEKMIPKCWQCDKKIKVVAGREKKVTASTRRLEYLRMKISCIWNEISQPESTDNLQYGNNVRSVDNWRMAAGYMSKYLGKEVDGKQWDELEPGRFWGFSNNFDFSAYYSKCYDIQEVQEVKAVLKNVVNAGYISFLKFQKSRLKRLPYSSNPQKAAGEQKKILNQIAYQKRRAKIQLMKIDRGAMVQVEVCRYEIQTGNYSLNDSEQNPRSNWRNFIKEKSQKTPVSQ